MLLTYCIYHFPFKTLTYLSKHQIENLKEKRHIHLCACSCILSFEISTTKLVEGLLTKQLTTIFPLINVFLYYCELQYSFEIFMILLFKSRYIYHYTYKIVFININ